MQIKATKCENADFCMPNYVLSKDGTPINQHFEIAMFTAKFCVDFAMQNPFKVWSTRPDMSRYQLNEHFTLKVQCTAKSTQAVLYCNVLYCTVRYYAVL